MKPFLIASILLHLCSALFAQTEGTMALMASLPQQMDINPAFAPKFKSSFTLPGTSFGLFYSNNGFTYNDLMTRQSDGSRVADLAKLRGALKPENYITTAFSIDLLRVSFRINNKLFMSLGAQGKTYSRLMLPKDAVNLLVDGNQSPTAGAGLSTYAISPKAEAQSFIEMYVGGAYQINQKLTVGLRLKYLKGLANATTQSADFNLTSDNSNYSISASGSADIRTSGVYNFSQSGYSFKLGDYLTNNGIGFDIGATYKVTDKLTVAASLLDIGRISWSNNLYGYSLDPTKANYTFKGFDLAKLVNNEPNYVQSITDSIQNKFKFVEKPIGSYSTALPIRAYASASYALPHHLTLSGVLFSENFAGRFNQGITLGANKHFGKWFSLAGSYTVSNNSFNNLGAGFSFNLAVVQFYMVGDNLLRLPFSGGELNSFVNSTQYFNLRAGLNFVFGWNPDKTRNAVNGEDFRKKGSKSNIKIKNGRAADFRRKKGR